MKREKAKLNFGVWYTLSFVNSLEKYLKEKYFCLFQKCYNGLDQFSVKMTTKSYLLLLHQFDLIFPFPFDLSKNLNRVHKLIGESR